MYDGVGEVQQEEECRQHSWRHIQDPEAEEEIPRKCTSSVSNTVHKDDDGVVCRIYAVLF